MLKKTCTCGKIIEYSQQYCDVCTEKVLQQKKNYYKHYDNTIRDKKAAAFYNSDEWEKTRQYILTRYKGLDLYSYYIDKELVQTDTVHHIEELRENWNRRLDIFNLFPLSSSNHSMIHKMYIKNKQETQQLLLNLMKKWENEFNKG